MIEAVNLTKRFDDIVAVDHISATIKDGSVFGLIGTNGAGKSTFLRLASGVLKPDEGCITIDGHEVFENTPYIFQGNEEAGIGYLRRVRVHGLPVLRRDL